MPKRMQDDYVVTDLTHPDGRLEYAIWGNMELWKKGHQDDQAFIRGLIDAGQRWIDENSI